MSYVRLVVSVTGVLGTLVVSPCLVWWKGRTTMQNELRNFIIPEEKKDLWKKAGERLGLWHDVEVEYLDDKETNPHKLWDSDLIKIHKDKTSSEESREEKLRNWCLRSYKKTFKSPFSKADETARRLSEDIKKVCVVSNWDMMGPEYEEFRKKYQERDQKDVEKWDQVKQIKTNWETFASNASSLPLDWIRDLAKRGKESVEKESRALYICSDILDLGFKGESSSEWKIVKEVCLKDVLKENTPKVK